MTAPPLNLRLGVLMLETGFPRPSGDIGNASSFSFPVDYEIIENASVERVVTAEGTSEHLVEAFVRGGHRLAARGATIIATSCGFLYPHQSQLAAALPLPVISSALCIIPHLRDIFGAHQPLGILTFDSDVLKPMLNASGHKNLVVEGIPRAGELFRVIKNDRPTLDENLAERECATAAACLMKDNPDVAAVVLECTNLPPYRKAIAAACNRPVYDILDLINLHADATSRLQRL